MTVTEIIRGQARTSNVAPAQIISGGGAALHKQLRYPTSYKSKDATHVRSTFTLLQIRFKPQPNDH